MWFIKVFLREEMPVPFLTKGLPPHCTLKCFSSAFNLSHNTFVLILCIHKSIPICPYVPECSLVIRAISTENSSLFVCHRGWKRVPHRQNDPLNLEWGSWPLQVSLGTDWPMRPVQTCGSFWCSTIVWCWRCCPCSWTLQTSACSLMSS